MKKTRMMSQDIAKGLAILVVVMLHTIPVTKIIVYVVGCLFCYIMPFFLFMSGYNYRNKGYTPWQNMTKRIGAILKPLAIYSLALFVIMGAYFFLHGDATIPEIFKSFAVVIMSKWGARLVGWEMPQVLFQRVLGPYWFLQFLIAASVIFYLVVDYAISSFQRMFSVTAVLTGMSVLMIEFGLVLPWGIQNAPGIAALMITAAWFHKTGSLFRVSSRKYWTVINCIVCVATIALIEIRYTQAGLVAAGALGEVLGGVEVYIMMIAGIMGSYFLINASRLIEKVPLLARGLGWLGRHTLQILLLHLSVMHILKDIFGLEQVNMAEKLIADRLVPMTFVVFALTMIIVIGLILLIEKFSAVFGSNKAEIHKAA